MEILFLILKVLGIILALLLLMIIVFLSVPVRYGFNIKVQDEAEGKAVIHWLFHLVDIRVFYRQKDISFRLRILGIPISTDKEKPDKKKKEKSDNRKKKKSEESGDRETEEPFSEETGESFSEKTEVLSLPEEIQKDTNDSVRTEQTELLPDSDMLLSEETDTEEKKKQTRKGWSRKKGSRGKRKTGTSGAKKRFRGPGQRAEGVKTGAATVKEQIENIKNMILEETNQNAFRLLLGEFRYLLRHYSPKKVYGTVRFAMGNPDQTGKVLGAISLFPGWSRYRIVVTPDFASEVFYLKGNLTVKGHVRALHVLVSGFRMIKDKNIRQLITNLRG